METALTQQLPAAPSLESPSAPAGLRHGVGIAVGLAVTAIVGVAAMLVFTPNSGGAIALVTWAIWPVALLLTASWICLGRALKDRRNGVAGILAGGLLVLLSGLCGIVLFVNVMLVITFANAG